MKLVRWGNKGSEKPGVVDREGRVRDLSGVLPDVAGEALGAASLDRLGAIDLTQLPLAPADARLGPCVGQVGKIVCVGLNYSDHAAESNMPVPAEPVLFFKATSSLSGPHDDVVIPPGAQKVDWEVELGVVIGKEARNVSRERALDYVAGYCIVNDVSERAWQIERGGQWDKGKSADTFAPLGPWLVTRDEIADPQALDMWLEVDGKRYQQGNTRTMIFDVATVVSYISHFMSLQPGDVISTGTPPGVGMGQKPQPVYLRAGQTMRLGVAGLGEQQQRAVASTVDTTHA
ncbi:fumarylacetoacetate hydrolase family protein [Burkholderia sp. Ax-1719]|uniref:fumarylacetoacetate hydrolase family protein n=1 Tax=Burkholderia sp. Ax-1719 TaxID=2608334 RepID=UPI00141DBF03|nr:fumarylacetoacetate hydrolase family protein [Burkholderia sp. Ax-1719]NIE65928.1 fumarylacetoacetate hydrolase family protein [Burkholderia sp. Ax-1719]